MQHPELVWNFITFMYISSYLSGGHSAVSSWFCCGQPYVYVPPSKTKQQQDNQNPPTSNQNTHTQQTKPHKNPTNKKNTTSPYHLKPVLQSLDITTGVAAVFMVGSRYEILSVEQKRKVQLSLGASLVQQQWTNLCPVLFSSGTN